jgi:hypothetical protein
MFVPVPAFFVLVICPIYSVQQFFLVEIPTLLVLQFFLWLLTQISSCLWCHVNTTQFFQSTTQYYYPFFPCWVPRPWWVHRSHRPIFIQTSLANIGIIKDLLIIGQWCLAVNLLNICSSILIQTSLWTLQMTYDQHELTMMSRCEK